MESQPQNPEFRKNPENFHPCTHFFTLAAVTAAENHTLSGKTMTVTGA